jgi:hypothetical protein
LANSIPENLQRKYFSENMEERGVMRGPKKEHGETFIGVRKKDPDFLVVANDNVGNNEASVGSTSSGLDLMREMRAASPSADKLTVNSFLSISLFLERKKTRSEYQN